MGKNKSGKLREFDYFVVAGTVLNCLGSQSFIVELLSKVAQDQMMHEHMDVQTQTTQRDSEE